MAVTEVHYEKIPVTMDGASFDLSREFRFTPLSYLLAQSEIIFKLVHIPLKDFNVAHGSMAEQDGDSSGFESDDGENVQKMKNVGQDHDDFDQVYHVRIVN